MEQSNLQGTLEEIKIVIEREEAKIKLFEALEILKLNPEFQLVIMNGYIDKLTNQLFKTLTEPTDTFDTVGTDDSIRVELEAIKGLNRYLGTKDVVGTIEREAENAKLNIETENNYRSELTKSY